MTATASDLFGLRPSPHPPSLWASLRRTVMTTARSRCQHPPTPPSGPPGWLSEVIDAHAQAHGGAARRLSQAAANIPADADPDDLTRLWSLVWPDRDPGQLWGSAASKELASRPGTSAAKSRTRTGGSWIASFRFSKMPWANVGPSPVSLILSD